LSDQQLADQYNDFQKNSVGSTERDIAFQKLKNALTSKTNIDFDARTTILNINGVVAVDDIDDHEYAGCVDCHSNLNDPDVMVSKLRSVGVSLNIRNPIVTVTPEAPPKRDPTKAIKKDPKAIVNQKMIKELEKAINCNIKKKWIISTEKNLYSKFFSLLPPGHPKLPVQNYVCFTQEMDKNIVGEQFIIKTFIRLPSGLDISIKY
jgi:hypothetical protein